MEKCTHCWHDTGKCFLTNPPYFEKICCKCGLIKTFKLHEIINTEKHGPYLPDNNYFNNTKKHDDI